MLGTLDPSDLGVVLPHEHLLLDFRKAQRDAEYGIQTNISDLTFKLENLGKIRQFPLVKLSDNHFGALYYISITTAHCPAFACRVEVVIPYAHTYPLTHPPTPCTHTLDTHTPEFAAALLLLLVTTWYCIYSSILMVYLLVWWWQV